MKLTVEVISDVICPWCFIGKRRLEKAVASLDQGTEVTVKWLPYQLNPAMPQEGVSRIAYRTQKFGSWERSQELDANVAATGQSEGIEFRFDLMEQTPNTVDAHRLVWLAGQHGCQDAVVEALFVAYFTLGKDVSNRESLIDVVVHAGLERQVVEWFLKSRAGLDEIEQANQLAKEVGVDGVPFFIINRKVALAGAQSPETFLQVFKQLASA